MIGSEDTEKELFEKIEILENTLIIYNDGNREVFDGVQINDNKVIFGRIKIIKKIKSGNNGKHLKLSNKPIEVFVETGVIPESNIKKIKGGKKRLIYHKK